MLVKKVNMKIVFLLLLYSISLVSSATDYYFSANGDDAADGLSSSTPWKTIAKCNSIFSSLKPGDRILFNRGDTFYGSLKISKSGLMGLQLQLVHMELAIIQ